MVAALAIGAVTMSFKMASTATTFHYTDAVNPGVFADPDNWQPGTSPLACNTGTTKPCEISAQDEQDLQDMLDGKDNTQVLSIVSKKRN